MKILTPLICTLLWLYAPLAYSQDTTSASAVGLTDSVKSTNPIIYAGADFGAGLTGVTGLEVGASINYQVKRHLFTVRYVGIFDFKVNATVIAPVLVIPGIQDKGGLEEGGLLYGRRYVENGRAFSFSAGLSTSKRTIKYKDSNNQKQSIEDRYIGFPFELNIMWFKRQKERFRIYGLIPVGKPTGFGSSIGFKLTGNISQHSYLAIGVTAALGYHKQY